MLVKRKIKLKKKKKRWKVESWNVGMLESDFKGFEKHIDSWLGVREFKGFK